MSSGNGARCSFTGGECDGGKVYPDGTVGCGYRESPESECAWIAEMPDGTGPRDFYNAACMEVMAG